MIKTLGEALAGAFAATDPDFTLVNERANVARADEMLALDPQMRVEAIRECERAVHLCESPIEQVALYQLAGFNFGNDEWPLRARILTKRGEVDHYPDLIHAIPQVKFGRYRVDILIDAGKKKLFAIECDGKDFHQDPEKDCARDAELKRDHGVRVYRVTGSAIWSGSQYLHVMCALIKQEIFP
jgi:hypothetical protein